MRRFRSISWMAFVVGGCFLAEGAFGQLLPFPLSANGRGTVTCLDVPSISYDIYLPPGYSTNGPPLPIVYTMSSTGGGLVTAFTPVCSAMNIIAVGLTGIKDGNDSIEIFREGFAVSRDIRQRVLFDPTAEFVSGISGGGEAAYWLSHARAQHWAGLLPMAGWMGVDAENPVYASTNRVLTNLLVARTTGNSDAAAMQNITPDSNYLVSCGAVVQDFYFNGGHEVAPDFVKTEAFNWLLGQRVMPGPNDQADSVALAANWNSRIAGGEADAVLRECVSTIMAQPRTWNALQAELVMDHLETNYASFRLLGIDDFAQGDFAGDVFYYAALSSSADGDMARYYSSMRGVTGVTGTNGDQWQNIQSMLLKYGYPAPILQICYDPVQDLMNLLVQKDAPGLLYSAHGRGNFSGAEPWLPQYLTGVETGTTWSAAFDHSLAPKYYRVATLLAGSSNQFPYIISSPQSVTTYLGATATFGVSVGGGGPFAYQWRKNGQYLADGGNIQGSTSLNLTVSSASQADAADYDLMAIGFNSVATTSAATLTVLSYTSNQIPMITSEPQSQTNAAYSTAVFNVTAEGDGPFAYQWRKNGSNLTDGGNILGSESSSLTVLNVSQADTASYDVIVTGFGSVTSAPPAILTVLPDYTLYLYEPFDYDNIGDAVTDNNLYWALNGSGADDLNVAAGNLSYAGLSPSVGNSVTNGGAGLGVRRLFSPGQNGGQLFFSALFQINAFGSWNGGSSQVGALTASDNQSFRLQILVKTQSSTNYVIGVQKGGTGATTTFDTTPHAPGETVLLVGEYDFATSPNTSTLWIDPSPATFGAFSPPSGSHSATSGTDAAYVIDRFNIRQNTATSVPQAMQWDELRIGASWAAVTPSGP